MKLKPETRTAALRRLLSGPAFAMPGAINALSARLIEQAGFEAVYVSGAVLSNSVGGVADVGLMTLTELATHCSYIANATSLPIVCDADTGFGGPENVAHAVRIVERAGVSGLHIEDQEFPKRCGHLEGKTLISQEAFCEKLTAAAQAKSDPDFLIIARTDARGVTGYDDAVARAKAYLEAGADAVFPEALQDDGEFRQFSQDVDTVLVANMTEFGRSPLMTVNRLGELGYTMVLFPVTLQRVAMYAMQDALGVLRRDGTQQSLIDRMQSRDELYDLLGYRGRVAAPTASQED